MAMANRIKACGIALSWGDLESVPAVVIDDLFAMGQAAARAAQRTTEEAKRRARR